MTRVCVLCSHWCVVTVGDGFSLPESGDASTGNVVLKRFDAWWKVASINEFDGIAVSREDNGKRYLTCPDCEAGVLGYYRASGDPSVFIACDLVAQTPLPDDDSKDFGKLPAGLSKEHLEGLIKAQSQGQAVESTEYTVEFTQDRIGLLLSEGSSKTQVEVYAFTEHKGNPGPAELTGRIRIGDVLTKVNGEDVTMKGCVSVLDLIVQTPRPISLSFLRGNKAPSPERGRAQHEDWVNPNKARDIENANTPCKSK